MCHEGFDFLYTSKIMIANLGQIDDFFFTKLSKIHPILQIGDIASVTETYPSKMSTVRDCQV